MSGYPFPGPRAPENNPPINPQYYEPGVFYISAISTGPLTTITTTENMDYVVGQIIRLLIPSFYGSFELNQQEGIVISIPSSNQVIVNINSIGVTPFISSPTLSISRAQIIPVGDINSGNINANGRVQNSTNIPGSFINVSPE